MFCPVCGKKIEEGMIQCTKCKTVFKTPKNDQKISASLNVNSLIDNAVLINNNPEPIRWRRTLAAFVMLLASLASFLLFLLFFGLLWLQAKDFGPDSIRFTLPLVVIVLSFLAVAIAGIIIASGILRNDKGAFEFSFFYFIVAGSFVGVATLLKYTVSANIITLLVGLTVVTIFIGSLIFLHGEKDLFIEDHIHFPTQFLIAGFPIVLFMIYFLKNNSFPIYFSQNAYLENWYKGNVNKQAIFQFAVNTINFFEPDTSNGDRELEPVANKPLSVQKNINSNTSVTIIYPKNLPSGETITLHQINNVGYSFYLGQVDYPNAAQIPDGLKNDITDVIYKSNFPKKLLSEIAILVVNTLAIKPDMRIQTPSGFIRIPEFPPVFLSGGGMYSQTAGSMSLIFINSKKVNTSTTNTGVNNTGEILALQISESNTKSFLLNTLTHELAHHIGSKMTDEEWKEFYKLRNIPIDTPRRKDPWQLSPTEDFAEVYTNVFTGNAVDTYYGVLTPPFHGIFDPCHVVIDQIMNDYSAVHPAPTYTFSGSNADWSTANLSYLNEKEKYQKNIDSSATVQNCRRDVLLNPDKYPDVKQYSEFSQLYTSEVSLPTKDFIKRTVARLN